MLPPLPLLADGVHKLQRGLSARSAAAAAAATATRTSAGAGAAAEASGSASAAPAVPSVAPRLPSPTPPGGSQSNLGSDGVGGGSDPGSVSLLDRRPRRSGLGGRQRDRLAPAATAGAAADAALVASGPPPSRISGIGAPALPPAPPGPVAELRASAAGSSASSAASSPAAAAAAAAAVGGGGGGGHGSLWVATATSAAASPRHGGPATGGSSVPPSLPSPASVGGGGGGDSQAPSQTGAANASGGQLLVNRELHKIVKRLRPSAGSFTASSPLGLPPAAAAGGRAAGSFSDAQSHSRRSSFDSPAHSYGSFGSARSATMGAIGAGVVGGAMALHRERLLWGRGLHPGGGGSAGATASGGVPGITHSGSSALLSDPNSPVAGYGPSALSVGGGGGGGSGRQAARVYVASPVTASAATAGGASSSAAAGPPGGPGSVAGPGGALRPSYNGARVSRQSSTSGSLCKFANAFVHAF